MNIDDPHPANQSEDELFTSRQSARHVSCALRRYFEAHLLIKAADLRRSQARSVGTSPPPTVSPYKSAKFTTDVLQESLDLLRESFPLRERWVCINKLLKFGGVTLLLQLVAMAVDCNTYTGKLVIFTMYYLCSINTCVKYVTFTLFQCT